MSLNKFEFSGADNIRLDVFVALSSNISRSRAAALIKGGNVTINGKKADKSSKLCSNDIVGVDVPEAQPYAVRPQNIPLDRYQ